MSNVLERMGLLILGAFIALGAEMRGWIDYNRDAEFWIMGAVLGLLFLSDYLRRNAKKDQAETSLTSVE